MPANSYASSLFSKQIHLYQKKKPLRLETSLRTKQKKAIDPRAAFH